MVQSPLVMRLLCGLCSSAVVSAAPALIWSSSSSSSSSSGDAAAAARSIYTSNEIPAASLFDDSIASPSTSSSSSLQVVFVLGRDSDGSESLTRMAPFLSVGRTAQTPATATTASPVAMPDVIHSFVSGIESVQSMKRTANAAVAGGNNASNNNGINNKNNNKVVVIGLHELGMKFNGSSPTTTTTKRSREIHAANVLLVDVDAQISPDVLDNAVQQAIARADRVVLTAVRSVAEVKDERAKITRRRMEQQYQAGLQRHQQQQRRRRLENNNNNNQQNQQQQEIAQDQSGIYFVQMTPNILSGLLFFALFATIAGIGISCMGMIAAQDVYVKKMPAVGREA